MAICECMQIPVYQTQSEWECHICGHKYDEEFFITKNFWLKDREIEQLRARVAELEKDALRYQWLRAQPDEEHDYTKSNRPWCVHYERRPGIPAVVVCNYATLDAAIDSAMVVPQQEQEGEGRE